LNSSDCNLASKRFNRGGPLASVCAEHERFEGEHQRLEPQNQGVYERECIHSVKSQPVWRHRARASWLPRRLKRPSPRLGDSHSRHLAHLVTTATGGRIVRICCRTPETAKPTVTKAQASRHSATNRPRTLRLMACSPCQGQGERRRAGRS
jgi:hypothetical protein